MRTLLAISLAAILLVGFEDAPGNVEGQPSQATNLNETAKSGRPLFLAQSRVNKCLVCCAERNKECLRREPPGAIFRDACSTLYSNCLSNCNSSGETPADWNCWAATK